MLRVSSHCAFGPAIIFQSTPIRHHLTTHSARQAASLMCHSLTGSTPAAAHVSTYQAYPEVGVGSTRAAAAGVCVAAEHAVAAHRAGGVTPVLDALPVEAMVAYLVGGGGWGMQTARQGVVKDARRQVGRQAGRSHTTHARGWPRMAVCTFLNTCTVPHRTVQHGAVQSQYRCTADQSPHRCEDCTGGSTCAGTAYIRTVQYLTILTVQVLGNRALCSELHRHTRVLRYT